MQSAELIRPDADRCVHGPPQLENRSPFLLLTHSEHKLSEALPMGQSQGPYFRFLTRNR